MSELIERIEKIENQGIEQGELNKKLLLSLTRLDKKTVDLESVLATNSDRISQVYVDNMNEHEITKKDLNEKIESISLRLVSKLNRFLFYLII